MAAPTAFRAAAVQADPDPDLRAAEDGPPDAQVAAGGLGDSAHDVQAEAGGTDGPALAAAPAAAPREGGPRIGDPRPRVGDEDDDGVAAVVDVDGEGGAHGGVAEDVAEQRVERGCQFGPGDGDAGRAVGPRDARLAPLVLRERRPEAHPLADHLGGVAPRLRRRPLGVRALFARGADDGVDLVLQLLDRRPGLLRRRALAEGGGVQPEHGERGAQPVREVGGQLPLVGEELDDLVGH